MAFAEHTRHPTQRGKLSTGELGTGAVLEHLLGGMIHCILKKISKYPWLISLFFRVSTTSETCHKIYECAEERVRPGTVPSLCIPIRGLPLPTCPVPLRLFKLNLDVILSRPWREKGKSLPSWQRGNRPMSEADLKTLEVPTPPAPHTHTSKE